jgi:selenocysteine lyase/cysteine desulfurase
MQQGDEIVCSAHDYYAMLDAIEQRQKRDGIVAKMIRPPLPAVSTADLAELYEKAIGPRTKLVLVTHASNTTGQLYPVKRIAAAAHRIGAEVVVDGAQTMALFDHKIPDLDCDYYGASLHKWLMAPVGSGLLWMRKEHVSKIWPLVPPPVDTQGMQRFMWSGTYPEFVSSAAAAAIAFNERIGLARKEARARYLTDYWRNKLGKIPRVKFYTTAAPDASCGIGIFEIAGVDSEKLQEKLWSDHKILVQYMKSKRAPELRGVRVTPNIYTSLEELDRFVGTTLEIVKQAGELF